MTVSDRAGSQGVRHDRQRSGRQPGECAMTGSDLVGSQGSAP